MGKLIIGTIAILGLLLPAPSFAVERLYRDDKGNVYFQCNQHGSGGRARVKARGNGRYRVYGGHYSGNVETFGTYKGVFMGADTPEAAARVACGEQM